MIDRNRDGFAVDAQLIIRTRDGGERVFALDDRRMVIGRETRCDLRVPLPSVSMKHCEIVFDGRVLELKDLGSASGTYHNGDRVERAVLSDSDRFSVGSVTFHVRLHNGRSR